MSPFSYRRRLLAAILGSILALGLAFGLGALVGAPLSERRAAASAVARLAAPAVSQTPVAGANPVQLAPAYDQDEAENISVYERNNEAVVNITTEVMAVNWFMEPMPQDGGSGSGSIIDPKGYVLTNNHVVKGAYKLFVNLADGSRYEAKVIGTDSESDLAVVKFEVPADLKLKTIAFGDSSHLKVGQKVLAIGNPFGLERTLSQGIVSGLGRPVQNEDGKIIRDMIQTDAAINPGNSGGPLLNTRGEMIGINTMIVSPSGGSVGIGFAIPVSTAMRIVPELIKNGKVTRGWIEFEPVQLFPELVDYMKQNAYPAGVAKGLLVSRTTKGGDADRAGIKGGVTAVRYGRSVFYVGGDIIVAVDGMKVATIADLYSALEDNRPGDKVTVEYYRGSKRLSTEIVLSDRAKYVQEN